MPRVAPECVEHTESAEKMARHIIYERCKGDFCNATREILLKALQEYAKENGIHEMDWALSGDTNPESISDEDMLAVLCATVPGEHTMAHALRPADCRHSMSDIRRCVVCGKDLTLPRKHVDTCGERCFRTLLKTQGGRT